MENRMQINRLKKKKKQMSNNNKRINFCLNTDKDSKKNKMNYNCI